MPEYRDGEDVWFVVGVYLGMAVVGFLLLIILLGGG